MFVESIRVGEIKTNCYLLGDESSRDRLVIDPGDDADKIIALAEKSGFEPTEIILTHSHYDHIGAATALKERFSIPISIHELDADALSDPNSNFSSYIKEPIAFSPDALLNGGEKRYVGVELTIIHAPGHTRGSIVLSGEGVLFSGDLIFKMGVGRTDLPGGDFAVLQNSVKKILILPDYTVIYPGHGQRTTLGEERAFLASLEKYF